MDRLSTDLEIKQRIVERKAREAQENKKISKLKKRGFSDLAIKTILSATGNTNAVKTITDNQLKEIVKAVISTQGLPNRAGIKALASSIDMNTASLNHIAHLTAVIAYPERYSLNENTNTYQYYVLRVIAAYELVTGNEI